MMIDSERSPANSTPHSLGSASPSRMVMRLLLVAVGWVLMALIAQVCVIFLLALVVGFQKFFVTRSGHGQPWIVSGWVWDLVAITAFQLTLLFIAWRRGKVAGDGDTKRGLGMMPVHRPMLLVGLSIATVPTVIFWSSIMLRLGVPGTTGGGIALALAATHKQALTLEIALLLVACVVAPIAEEWFFRGWLWTALRRHLDPLETILITGTFWLSLHMFENPFRPFYLFPLAVLLSIARYHCDSVRASLALHLINNLAFLSISYFALTRGS